VFKTTQRYFPDMHSLLRFWKRIIREYYFKRVLHPCRDFFETKVFSKYDCIYWGIILWQNNATISWRNGMPHHVWGICHMSLCSMNHCKKMLQYIFSRYFAVFNEYCIDQENVLLKKRIVSSKGPHMFVAIFQAILRPWKRGAKHLQHP